MGAYRWSDDSIVRHITQKKMNLSIIGLCCLNHFVQYAFQCLKEKKFRNIPHTYIHIA